VPAVPKGNGNGTAVCPGSYDPVTLGHLDIITRASVVFDNVIVGVVNQPVRKQKTLFSAEERVGFIQEEIGNLQNVQVMPFATLLIDFARDQNPDRRIVAYTTQARAPLFDTAPFELRGRPTADGRGAQLWAVTPEGTVAMSAPSEG